MSLWTDAELTAIYTLSPLHYGVGQTAAAVDLPIARDAASSLPILPATGLKGVARDHIKNHSDMPDGTLKRLFGPDLRETDSNSEQGKDLEAGNLGFTEGRLIAYPLRSLNRPFLHATCPMILEQLARDLRALGLEERLFKGDPPRLHGDRIAVADPELDNTDLILEDLIYTANQVQHDATLTAFAQQLAQLLPDAETATRQRLQQGLVLLPDAAFAEVLERAVPVRARIQLTDGKTTDKWTDPDGKEQSGNLWYEEHLPSDCLFVSFIGQRHSRTRRDASDTNSDHSLNDLRQYSPSLNTVQIGGNETVGYGLCWWSGWTRGKQA